MSAAPFAPDNELFQFYEVKAPFAYLDAILDVCAAAMSVYSECYWWLS